MQIIVKVLKIPVKSEFVAERPWWDDTGNKAEQGNALQYPNIGCVVYKE